MSSQVHRVKGALNFEGMKFPFYLECKTTDLGTAATVQYFYMPASHFRQNKRRNGISNFQSCLDFFLCLMQRSGHADDWDQQRDYILARCYGLLHRDKAVQHVYRDAFLRPHSFRPEDLNLSVDVIQKLDNAVQSRRADAIRQTMETALQAQALSREERIASTAAMDQWLNAGVGHYRRDGEAGLTRWLHEVEEWYARFRKRSPPLVRTFLRVFAYEAKVSMYHKYAQFWIALMPWLASEFSLDPASQRFLRIWHNQNQRVEVPHGRTPSGILYPTTAGRQVLRPESNGRFARSVIWTTEHVGPEVIPDVFLGQVLALHPLSWILLARPELAEAVGRCVTSPRFDDALSSGQVGEFNEYWDMVRAILIAANLYRVAHAQLESSRNVVSVRVPRSNRVAHSAADMPPELILKDFIDSRSLTCPCGEKQALADGDLPTTNSSAVSISVICTKCALLDIVEVTLEQLMNFLSDNKSLSQ